MSEKMRIWTLYSHMGGGWQVAGEDFRPSRSTEVVQVVEAAPQHLSSEETERLHIEARDEIWAVAKKLEVSAEAVELKEIAQRVAALGPQHPPLHLDAGDAERLLQTFFTELEAEGWNSDEDIPVDALRGAFERAIARDLANQEVQVRATVPASEYDALADAFRDFVADATMTPASEVGVIELGEYLRDLADDEYAFLAQALKQGSRALTTRREHEAQVRPTAGRDEHAARLRAKLVEEVGEYLAQPSIGELADILEVVHALAYVDVGRTFAAVEQERDRKWHERGGFNRGLVMETVEPEPAP